MRGATYARKGAFEQAFADFDLAISVNDKYPLAHYARGYAKLLHDRPDEAIAEFDQAIKLDPIYVSAFAARGLAYQKLENQPRAKADFSAALEIPLKCGGDDWGHDVAQRGLTPSPSISAGRW